MLNEPVFIFLGIAILILAVLHFLMRGDFSRARGAVEFPYQAQTYFFSRAERSFLGVLESVLDSEHRVFGKVNFYDIVKVTKNTKNRQAAFNRISQKHIDFVICRKDDLSIQCLIELDDKSHGAPDRQERDKFVDKVCDTANIKLIHIPAQQTYSRTKIAALLEPYSAQ